MLRTALIATSITAALIGGGLTLKHRTDCANLETDFLNEFAATLRSDERPTYDHSIDALTTRCGTRAADTAIRKAAEAAGV